jgi:amidase
VDTDTGDVFDYTDDESTALLYEFRAQIADYLATLGHTNMRTLADLIAFNNAHCRRELVYYGQEVFEQSELAVGYPDDPTYVAARTHARSTARSGIDNALAADNLDAIVAPHLTNSTGPAVAGYPNLSLPVGIRDNGRPAGMLMYSTFLHEPQLIGFGFDLEQELNVRRQPQFLGSVIPIPNANLCDQATQPQVFTGRAHIQHGRIF